MIIKYRSCSLLHLRIEKANCDTQCCARLKHARACAQQRQVLIIGSESQLIEDRIVKALPPIAVFPFRGFDGAAARIAILVGERSQRCHKVRANGTACNRQKYRRRKQRAGKPVMLSMSKRR